MLLECRVGEGSFIVLDAESTGGIDKSVTKIVSHPDQVVGQTLDAIRAIAGSFGAGVGDSAERPSTLEVQFGVRVDSNATVTVAKTPEQGQFRVTLRWRE